VGNLKGYTATFQGAASDTDLAGQVALVENAVNRKVAGIVLAPSDPDALIPAIKKAWEAKIPVVLIDSAASDAGKAYYQSFLATDNKAAGEMSAKTLIDKIGTTGKIAIMSYTAGSGSEIGRVGGFTDYIKKHSKLQIVGPFYSNSQMGTALNQTTDVLAANPDLKGIFGANEPTAIGMGRALVQSGKAGKVVAIGFDGNADLQGFVKDGTIEAIAVQSAFEMGNLGVKTVAEIVGRQESARFPRYRRVDGEQEKHRYTRSQERSLLTHPIPTQGHLRHRLPEAKDIYADSHLRNSRRAAHGRRGHAPPQ
jgi:ribose transport system substrate-binding protein